MHWVLEKINQNQDGGPSSGEGLNRHTQAAESEHHTNIKTGKVFIEHYGYIQDKGIF